MAWTIFSRRLNQAGSGQPRACALQAGSHRPPARRPPWAAAALRDLVPPRFVAESVAEAILQAGNLAGKRIFAPQGKQGAGCSAQPT